MKDFVIKLIAAVFAVAAIFEYDSIVNAREEAREAERLAVEEENARIEEENARLLESLGVSGEEETDKGPLTDGVYTASAEGYAGIIEIEMTVSGGFITALDVASAESEDIAYMVMAESITDDIIEAQSADVDTVSGATLSSTAIREAAASAIEEASE